MAVFCAWCKKLLGEKPSHRPETSHGICRDCKEMLLRKEGAVVDNLESILSRDARELPPLPPPSGS